MLQSRKFLGLLSSLVIVACLLAGCGGGAQAPATPYDFGGPTAVAGTWVAEPSPTATLVPTVVPDELVSYNRLGRCATDEELVAYGQQYTGETGVVEITNTSDGLDLHFSYEWKSPHYSGSGMIFLGSRQVYKIGVSEVGPGENEKVDVYITVGDERVRVVVGPCPIATEVPSTPTPRPAAPAQGQSTLAPTPKPKVLGDCGATCSETADCMVGLTCAPAKVCWAARCGDGGKEGPDHDDGCIVPPCEPPKPTPPEHE